MRLTKTLLLAAVATTLSAPAFAGGFAPVAVEAEPVVIVEPTPRRSSLGILLPILLVGALVAAASGGEDGGTAVDTQD